MNENEKLMSRRGKEKVYSQIYTKKGNEKTVGTTQIGQQLLLEEGIRILPQVRDWIDNGTAKLYRKELQDYFTDDQILLTKIVESFLLLVGSVRIELSNITKNKRYRHKRINYIQEHIFKTLPFNQVWRFIEIIIDFSKYFEIGQELSKSDGKYKFNTWYECNLNNEILDILEMEACKAFYPLPSFIPPLDWKFDENGLSGGYTDKQLPLVRTSYTDVDYNLYSKNIFDAVNYIQSVPWIVNEEVLEIVKRDLVHPKKEDFLKTDFPKSDNAKFDIDVKDVALGLTKKEVKKIIEDRALYIEQLELFNAEKTDYESAVGKYRAVKLAIHIAEWYAGETIYFPHSYDFRGRIYPIPIGLSPQGSDAVKAMLLYKEVEKPTAMGRKWNWAYLATLYGDDKISFYERVERGKELLYVDYKQADEPYQFLSHQIEMQKYVADDNYIPNTRIHLDACNSGSQFTSAITGDVAGCVATNVIPSYDLDGKQSRQDAYLLVANKALDHIDRAIDFTTDKEDKKVNLFFKDLLEKDGRKICKVPVMVSNYGGTDGGRNHIIESMFRELKVPRIMSTKINASRLSKIIGDSIQGVLTGGKAFERYIQQMSDMIARGQTPVIWNTLDGFHVVHIKNKELKSIKARCMLPNSRRHTDITKKMFSKDVSPGKMRSAISPNYIHSLDAELLRMVAIQLKKDGIKNTAWIHDSFGCHPNYVNRMLEVTKDKFYELIKSMPLQRLDEELRTQVPNDKRLQKKLNLIKIPKLDKKNHFVGQLKQVKNSDWFFS